MKKNKLPLLLELAKKSAKKAGINLIKQKKLARQIYQFHPRDVKIKGDVISESIIIDSLLKYSSFPILSEEKGIIGKMDKEQHLWIVDPLDGSLNFSQEIPMYCISIALFKENKPILGVIFDFERKELFSGVVGEGAWLNGNRIKTSETTKKNEAILCTGFPISNNFSEKGITRFVKQIKSYKKVRLLGSAALSLAYVACGRADIYFEDNIMIWDVGAGCAIVKAAGGKIQINNFLDHLKPVIVEAKSNILL